MDSISICCHINKEYKEYKEYKEDLQVGAGPPVSRSLFMTQRLVPVSTIVLAVSLVVAGCGGGGGSVRPDPEGSVRSDPACVQTADLGCLFPQEYEERREEIERDHGDADDFKNQWGLSTIRADRAWAQLELRHGAGTEPGSGQTVGLIDSGIDTGHQVFAGKTVTEQFLAGAVDEIGDDDSHGTSVASVIAASPSAAFTDEVTAASGVAPGRRHRDVRDPDLIGWWW